MAADPARLRHVIWSTLEDTRDFSAEFCGPRDVAATRALNPALLDFDGWLARYAAQVPLG